MPKPTSPSDQDHLGQATTSPSRTQVPRRTRTDPRRTRTPARLIAAGRVVFSRDGFHNARLSDITAEAQVSVGTFYTYYRTKEELFRDVMAGVVAELTDRAARSQIDTSDPIVGIYESNRAYVAGYRRNARLMALLLQVAELDTVVNEQRLEIRSRFQDRLVRAIQRWQDQGLVYADLDPLYTANALAYMVDRFLYEWTVVNLDYDEERVVDMLSRLWVRALGLDHQGKLPPSTGLPVPPDIGG